MITGIIYNRVPNTSNGQLGYTDRWVGQMYQIGRHWVECERIELETILINRQEYLTLKVYFTGDIVHTIPYNHDIEIIDERATANNEGNTEQGEVSTGE